jgi:hypothetical protein
VLEKAYWELDSLENHSERNGLNREGDKGREDSIRAVGICLRGVEDRLDKLICFSNSHHCRYKTKIRCLLCINNNNISLSNNYSNNNINKDICRNKNYLGINNKIIRILVI